MRIVTKTKIQIRSTTHDNKKRQMHTQTDAMIRKRTWGNTHNNNDDKDTDDDNDNNNHENKKEKDKKKNEEKKKNEKK